MNTAELKYRLRREALSRRAGLSPEFRRASSQTVCEKIASTRAYKDADTIMLYAPVRAELDTGLLASIALRDGKTVLYPYCLPDGNMLALKPEGSESWKAGSFGIPEPDPECCCAADPADIDLVICPCTAFDENCGRIGMGGGYYDRFLPGCSGAVKIAAAFEAQKTERVPLESFDIEMDAVVTETAVHCKGDL